MGSKELKEKLPRGVLKSISETFDYKSYIWVGSCGSVKENKVIDQLNYSEIEPVGGNYGNYIFKKARDSFFIHWFKIWRLSRRSTFDS